MEKLLIQRSDVGIIETEAPNYLKNLIPEIEKENFELYVSDKMYYWDSKKLKLRFEHEPCTYVKFNGIFIYLAFSHNIEKQLISRLESPEGTNRLKQMSNVVEYTKNHNEMKEREEKEKRIVEEEKEREQKEREQKENNRLKNIYDKIVIGGENFDSDDIINFIKKYSTTKLHIRTIGSIIKSWVNFSFSVKYNSDEEEYEIYNLSGKYIQVRGKAKPKFPNFKIELEFAIDNFKKSN